MPKRAKDPTLEVYTAPCPHPRCGETLQIPGRFSGEGLCNCHALRIHVEWEDWTPVVKMLAMTEG